MNEELLSELSEAMKRREKALAGNARWQEQLTDAEEDIAELSQRITDTMNKAPEPEQLYVGTTTANEYEPRIFEPVTE